MDIVKGFILSMSVHSDDAYIWCINNCDGFKHMLSVDEGRIIFLFEHNEDALLFKMVWGHLCL